MKTPTPLNVCPIVPVSIGPSCPVTRCMHNRSGSCCYVEVLAIDGDLNKTSAIYSVPPAEVQARVTEIQIGLVAANWFEHINNKSILEGKGCDFQAAADPKQIGEFTNWNVSAFSFGQVLVSLELISSRL